MQENHGEIRQQLENVLELDFEDRALLYTHEISRPLISERIKEISSCSDHPECTALNSRIEGFEHAAAREYLAAYIAEEPRKRIEIPAYAARLAIHHVLKCALLQEHAGATYGDPECKKMEENLLRKVEDDHIESVASSIRKELEEDEPFQRILRLREDAERRNSEEWL